MEKKIRSLLIRILGFERYLKLVSHVYLRCIRAGWFRSTYPELFYLKHLIQPGFVCVDIGANVGYYSVFLSEYAGASGSVYAVEPVALFTKVFGQNIKTFTRYPNVTLFHTALGGNEGTVTMGTPIIDGVLRHGLTHVLEAGENRNGMATYEVPLQVPDVLFSKLPRIDFVKCDVEGYEVYLFPHFLKTLSHHRPIIQIEITGKERIQTMLNLLTPLGYSVYGLKQGNLVQLTENEALNYTSDFYFKPRS